MFSPLLKPHGIRVEGRETAMPHKQEVTLRQCSLSVVSSVKYCWATLAGTDRRVSPVDFCHEGEYLLRLVRLALAEQPRGRLRHPLVQHDGDEVGQGGDQEEGLPRWKHLGVINFT